MADEPISDKVLFYFLFQIKFNDLPGPALGPDSGPNPGPGAGPGAWPWTLVLGQVLDRHLVLVQDLVLALDQGLDLKPSFYTP